jgi:tetratricopeptide (TPR) repeat protein
MPLTTIITEALIDVAKKQLFEVGKKVAHGFFDSATGKNLGQLICYRKEGRYNNVLLFVHGFSGSPTETFGFTPDMLANCPEFAGWDIFSIGYSSDVFPSIGKGLWSVNPDITKISWYLKTLLENQFGNYSRVAFVAHSMGGLAVQRVILDLPDVQFNKISHVLFFGTPSAGLKKAFWLRFWNTHIHDLSYKSDFIKKLREDWSKKFKEGFEFTFKTIAGTKDDFVPVESSLFPFEEKYRGVIEGNHITMIKPNDINDLHQQSFEIILGTLIEQKITSSEANNEDINILMGNYYKIIQQYLPDAKKLALKPLADLVFALECSGKQEDAIKILQEHPKAISDSDTLGIIGGRYKRKYLLEKLQSDLDKAFDYYQRALVMSENNPSQIYYHAINLAFLNNIAKNQKTEMKRYAQLALDNCNSNSEDMWEVATIAEANLYLGKKDVAEDYFKKAAQIAGTDVRAKQSIYSNAYYGYQALTGSKNEKAEFILMLDKVLS